MGTATFTVSGEDRQVLIIDLAKLRNGKLAERWAMLDRPEVVEAVIAEVAAGEASA